MMPIAGCDLALGLETPDAPRKVEDCDPSYTLVLDGMPDSRYLVVTTLGHWKTQSALCRASGGHLVSLETFAEVGAVLAAIDSTIDEYHVGAFQMPAQSDVRAGWMNVTGGPALDLWEPAQPNDNGLTISVEDGEEQFASLRPMSGGFRDVPSNESKPAICECDFLPLVDEPP
jgi:hypothetical protein